MERRGEKERNGEKEKRGRGSEEVWKRVKTVGKQSE